MESIFENIFSGKKIGIWGFGKTGQSILSFLVHRYQTSTYAAHTLNTHTPNPPLEIFIYEHTQLTAEQNTIITRLTSLKSLDAAHPHLHVKIIDPKLLLPFLELCDLIIPSPGIDLAPYLPNIPNTLEPLDETLEEQSFACLSTPPIVHKILTELDLFSLCVTT